MPILNIYSPLDEPPAGLLESLCSGIIEILRLPSSHCWAIWHAVGPRSFHRPSWRHGDTKNGPVVIIHCKTAYCSEEIAKVLFHVRNSLSAGLGCDSSDVYVAVQRVRPKETMMRNAIWSGDDIGVSFLDIVLSPVAVVHSPRTDLTDDFWGDIESVIEFDNRRFGEQSLFGLSDFSHVEVIFFFNRVPPESVETGARHPRDRLDWPLVGIFAQRGKARPNRIGVSRCKILGVEGTCVRVQGLDAIDGTPVLDLKPYFEEFGPRSEVKQPAWTHEVMRNYFKSVNEE